MADPLSVAASVADLLTITGTIIIEGYTFINTARQRSPGLKQLLKETTSLKTFLEKIEVLGNEFGAVQSNINTGMDGLSDIITPAIMAEGKTLLQSVQSSIRACQQKPGQRSNNIGSAVLWPLKKREVQETLDKFRQLVNTLGQAQELIILWVNLALLLLLITNSGCWLKAHDSRSG